MTYGVALTHQIAQPQVATHSPVTTLAASTLRKRTRRMATSLTCQAVATHRLVLPQRASHPLAANLWRVQLSQCRTTRHLTTTSVLGHYRVRREIMWSLPQMRGKLPVTSPLAQTLPLPLTPLKLSQLVSRPLRRLSNLQTTALVAIFLCKTQQQTPLLSRTK